MRWLTAVLITLMLLGLTNPVQASSPMVFRTDGSVLATYCDFCPFVSGTVRGAGQEASLSTEDGIGQVLIPGALENGGTFAKLVISDDLLEGRYAEVSLLFYSSRGHLMAHYDTLGDEHGCIPQGAAFAVARLDLGVLADFTYIEFNTTSC